jgi:hypothetical protein
LIHDSLSRWHFGELQQLDAPGNLWASSAEPPEVHGRRRPRIGFPALIGWLLGHYGARGLRALTGL